MTELEEKEATISYLERALKQAQETLRDRFAMSALTGLLSNPKLAEKCRANGGAYSGFFEKNAFAYAEYMIEARDVSHR